MVCEGESVGACPHPLPWVQRPWPRHAAHLPAACRAVAPAPQGAVRRARPVLLAVGNAGHSVTLAGGS